MLRFLIAALACASLLLAVDSEDHVRKSTPVSAATRVVLTADVGAIRVEPGGSSDVEVEVTFKGNPPSRAEFERMRRDFALDIEHQGSDIRVTGEFRAGWEPFIFSWPFWGHQLCRNGQCLVYASWLREVEYRVLVPKKFNADVETAGGPISVSSLGGHVDARTSGGPLNFDGIEGPINGRTSGGPITLIGGKGRVVVHTSGGPIKIREVEGDVDASTSGGPISIERNLGRVRAHTSGGGIWIRDAAGSIDASTSGGGVSATLVGQPKEECRLYTSGGSIDVRLGKDVHVDLDASSSGGRVWTDFERPYSDDRHSHELHTAINGGGPRLYLHTSGGGISVRHD